ncbi:hypothetical protein ACFWN7_06210 [Agromyces sp. NPDC058484]|uniref:hypothetical protein n=1 Tax=Agromyces sp. NPDC058484 TaxID=3346524 RepID=UPI003647CD59
MVATSVVVVAVAVVVDMAAPLVRAGLEGADVPIPRPHGVRAHRDFRPVGVARSGHPRRSVDWAITGYHPDGAAYLWSIPE